MSFRKVPGLHAGAFLLIALSLSIGWGIRGNFGHEYGAMIAGVLSAIAACLISGRADWRARLPYIAMFGALGWGFGATISYMQVIAYTHSGHLPSQIYGFAALFLIGFLWAALGGAGTSFAAVADDKRLRDVFRPLGWILVMWLLLALLVEPLLEHFVSGFTSNEHRHESPLYWFDADWLQALTALVALGLFDLWDRRFAKFQWLPFTAVLGAGAGYLLQRTGMLEPVGVALLRYEGDLSVVPKEQLVINWPQFFLDIPQHLGWMFGLLIGIIVYFAIFGKFRSGASMFVHMACGWFVAFLILPVLLGIRLTPPRGDDWAGILGLFIGLTIYLARNGMTPVIFASLVAGIVGGLGFSGVQMLKLVMLSPGNPAIVGDPAVVQYWEYWRSANWHSWLEQSYGFVNGVGIALAMGLLASRVPAVADPDAPESNEPYVTKPILEAMKIVLAAGVTACLAVYISPGAAVVFILAVLLPYFVPRQALAVGFTLFLVTFLNLFKNVDEWVGRGFPASMRAPLFPTIEFTAHTWFVIAYVSIALAGMWLMTVHVRRRKLALVPASWLGKGQLLYLAFLWIMVIGNFERALMGFTEQRLLTEWVIFINAVIVTILIVLLPGDEVEIAAKETRGFARSIALTLLAGMLAFVIAISAETGVTRAIYGDAFMGAAGKHIRFGPNASWRVEPIQKGQGHL